MGLHKTLLMIRALPIIPWGMILPLFNILSMAGMPIKQHLYSLPAPLPNARQQGY